MSTVSERPSNFLPKETADEHFSDFLAGSEKQHLMAQRIKMTMYAVATIVPAEIVKSTHERESAYVFRAEGDDEFWWEVVFDTRRPVRITLHRFAGSVYEFDAKNREFRAPTARTMETVYDHLPILFMGCMLLNSEASSSMRCVMGSAKKQL